MVLDTGLSYTMAPIEDINAIEKNLLKEGIECKNQQHGGNLDLFECTCTNEQYKNLKPFQMEVQGNQVELAVSSLIKKHEDKDKCTILIYPRESLTMAYEWVMGDQFLQNFYTIFDMKEKRIGLAKPRQ